jgi:superfamily II DNA or RNA helicase
MIETTLRDQPGLTARELLRELRRSGRVSSDVRKRNLNQVLYGEKAFVNDGGYVPRWRLLNQAEPRAERRATTIQVRTERARLDATAERMAERSTAHAAASPVRRAAAQVNWGTVAVIPGLHDWQRRAVGAWIDAGAVGVVEAVTGTGKTHLGLELASRLAAQGGQTTVLVPTVELQRQWCEKFAQFAGHLTLATVGGRRSGDHRQADVTVALVQSAINTDLTPVYRPGLLVADEVHRYGARTWSTALRHGYDHRLGLTATLERDGDRGVTDYLIPYFRRSVFRYTYEQAIPEGVVAPFTLAMLGVDLSSDEQAEYDHISRKMARARAVLQPLGVFRGTQADIQQRLATLARAGGVAGEAAIEYQKRARHRRLLLARCTAKITAVGQLAELVGHARGAVIFAQTIDSAEQAATQLRRAHVQSAAIHSGMHGDERRENLDRLRDQSIAALCAPKILDEGIDVPDLDLGIVMSASSSRRQMIQRLGRVIRLKDGGRHARFVTLYAECTVEDHLEGAHETFLDMVREVAVKQTRLVSWSLEDVQRALAMPSDWTPNVRPAPPSPSEPTARPEPATSPPVAPRHRPPMPPSAAQPTVSPSTSNLLAEVLAPRGWERACEEGGVIRAKGRACWAPGFRGLVSPDPVGFPHGEAMVERVRSIVIDTALDRLLDRSQSHRTTWLADDILDALSGELTQLGGRTASATVYRKLRVPVPSSQAKGGYTLLRADLVMWRRSKPSVVLQVDPEERRDSPRILDAAARSGALALWVPLYATVDVNAPPGVRAIDMRVLLRFDWVGAAWRS